MSQLKKWIPYALVLVACFYGMGVAAKESPEASKIEQLQGKFEHHKELQASKIEALAQRIDTAVTNSQKAADWWVNASGILLTFVGLFATVVGLFIPFYFTRKQRLDLELQAKELVLQSQELNPKFDQAAKDVAEIQRLLKQSQDDANAISDHAKKLEQVSNTDPTKVSPGTEEAAKVTLALSAAGTAREQASPEERLRLNALEAQSKNDWQTAISLWTQLCESKPQSGEFLSALANAQSSYANKQSDPSTQNKFWEAVVLSYQQALPHLTGDQQAAAQNNLGKALFALGERESDSKNLHAAVAAYNEALKERTRERLPLDWAATQNNLGMALSVLGEREGDSAKLNAAVAAYNRALKEWTRERAPLDWAMTQNNLGNALSALGERESDSKDIHAAVAAYREALKEQIRERVPIDWAMTQNNVGAALQALGKRDSSASGLQLLRDAKHAYTQALEVFEAAKASHHITRTKENLARVQALLDKRGGAG